MASRPPSPSGNREKILDGSAEPEDLAMLDEAIAAGELTELPEATIARWEGLCEMNDTEAVRQVLDPALAAQGLAIDPRGDGFRRLCLDATRVAAAAYRIERDRYDGKYGDAAPPSWIDQHYPLAPPAIRAWSGQLFPEEIDFLARPIAEIAEEYIERQRRTARVRKTERDWRMAARYFVGLVSPNDHLAQIFALAPDTRRSAWRRSQVLVNSTQRPSAATAIASSKAIRTG